MDFIGKLLKDAGITRAFTENMKLQAAGWKSGTMDADTLMQPQQYFYIWDRKRDWIWMASMPVSIASSFAKKVIAQKKQQALIRGCLGSVIDQFSAGTPPGQVGDFSAEAQLAVLSCGYACTTQTWGAAQAPRANLHFIIIRYEPVLPGSTGLLRPFASPGAVSGPLPVDALQAMLEQVNDIDQQSHPEWFRGIHRK